MFDPTISAVLRSNYTSRRFFLLYGLVLLATLLALWMTYSSLPAGALLREVLVQVLGNFAATVGIVICTYTFYLYVTPPGLRNANIIPLMSAEISDEIVNMSDDATDYWFLGRSGSYFRAKVLPKLEAAALKDHRHISVRIVLPNFDAQTNRITYLKIKQSLGEPARETTLAANVVATIAAAVVASARNNYLTIRIGLSATVPVLRHDISSKAALLTRDAKGLPAVLVNAGNPYFEMFRDVVENELAQSIEITWDRQAAPFFNAGTVSLQDILSAVHGLPPIDDTILAEAEPLLTAKPHRYGV